MFSRHVKTVLKKEQGMAFARAVAAGFEIEHVANYISFAECFGASRLMSVCLRFIDSWKQKHESGWTMGRNRSRRCNIYQIRLLCHKCIKNCAFKYGQQT